MKLSIMKLKLLLILGLLGIILGMLSCRNNKSSNKESESSTYSLIAKQITISQLDKELELLKEGKTEFDFIGITSNGIDCIYFMKCEDKFNIGFEAMTEEQVLFIDKLKEYAKNKGFQHKMATYGNKPHYQSVKEAPVIVIETNTILSETAKLGEEIENIIFGNNIETRYDVVP